MYFVAMHWKYTALHRSIPILELASALLFSALRRDSLAMYFSPMVVIKIVMPLLRLLQLLHKNERRFRPQ
jgi:hypothetical protein